MLSTYTDPSLTADSMRLTASCPHHRAYSTLMSYNPSEGESKQTVLRSVVVAPAYNPSTWEAEAGGSL